jgi:hypothetical protein
MICLAALLLAVSVLSLQQASAQAVYGSIIGTATDPQGAVVPNAKITVTNQSKNTSDTTTSNDNRSYHVSSRKIATKLGYTPQRSIEDAVRDLCCAFRAGNYGANPDTLNAVARNGLSFTDTLPAGLVIANPPVPTSASRQFSTGSNEAPNIDSQK